jgi:hypothetical protein
MYSFGLLLFELVEELEFEGEPIGGGPFRGLFMALVRPEPWKRVPFAKVVTWLEDPPHWLPGLAPAPFWNTFFIFYTW